MAIVPHHRGRRSRDGFSPAIIVAFVMLSAPVTAARAQEIGDARAGLAYAKRACAECHAVLASDTASPLAKATPFRVFANTPGVTGTAIAVWLRTPHPSMPNLMVTGDDLENLVAYILELKDKPGSR